MLFHSLQFLIFLPIVFALYWSVAGHKRLRQFLLLAASFLFYMAWNPAPIVLILYLSTSDWLIGRRMYRETRPKWRTALVYLSVTNNLTVLGVFKYADWITRSVVDAAEFFNLHLVYQPTGLILPVGLSFVVFQCMSYTIDIYREELPARKSWMEVTLYISFFPQIVAGPIVRAADFLPQLDHIPRLTEQAGVRALVRIALGMFKKLVIADLLAANIVNRVFVQPDNYSGIEVISAVFSYTAQIYYDFSAYSDIAIGCAALFGFHIAENFDKPYLSTNLFEFWRRWHISLGRWLFDYLYLPLGGNRCSRPRILWNLWVTMILGSVWHGADWRFVAWGAVHGIILIANRLWWWTFGKPDPNRSFYIKLFTGILTFLAVMEARIVFHAPNMTMAWRVFVEQFKTTWATPNLTPLVLTVIALAFIGHIMPNNAVEKLTRFFIVMPIPLRAASLLILALGIKQVSNFEVQPFIYFQF